MPFALHFCVVPDGPGRAHALCAPRADGRIGSGAWPRALCAQGPFSTFANKRNASLDIMYIKFSPDGNFLLCSTNENYIFLMHSFNGKVVQEYTDHQNTSGALDPGFTADGKYVASGTPRRTPRSAGPLRRALALSQSGAVQDCPKLRPELQMYDPRGSYSWPCRPTRHPHTEGGMGWRKFNYE